MTLPQIFPPSGSRMVVIGGCGGMGQALVKDALAVGLRVAVLDLPRSIAQFAPPEGVLTLTCDISDEASVNAAFEAVRQAWGGLDILVNLAGFTGEPIPVRELSAAEWDATHDCGLRGMFLAARAAIPLLERGNNPSMVLTASTFGHSVVHAGYSAYAAAKAGVVSLGKALAAECAPRIRVNVVSPGVFMTPFLQGGTGRDPRQKEGIDMQTFPRRLPLRRLGDAAEIAAPILFLAGPGASYITGQVLHVNGGLWAP